MRVLGFAGGDTDHLDAAEGEHHHGERSDHAAHAIGEEAAMAPQVAHCRQRLAGAAQLDTEHQHGGTCEDHRDDGGDFQQRQPELQFAKHPHAAQVQGANEEDDAQHPDPARRVGEPEAHVDAEGSDIRQAHHQHREGVAPACEKAGKAPQVLAGVLTERAGHRVAHGHLAEGAHHHVDGRATDQVSEQHRRAGQFDGGCGAIEKPGADGRTERHEANVAGTQTAPHGGAVFVHPR
ncbi:hypothetical protein D3C79_627140 [compost metagenome]